MKNFSIKVSHRTRDRMRHPNITAHKLMTADWFMRGYRKGNGGALVGIIPVLVIVIPSL